MVASEVAENEIYSLVGCTVSPGFDFDDFELPSRSKMIDLFPVMKKSLYGWRDCKKDVLFE